MPKREQIIEELAQSEDLEVLWNAFYTALEADLSARGWPGNSRVIFTIAAEEIESIMGLVDD